MRKGKQDEHKNTHLQNMRQKSRTDREHVRKLQRVHRHATKKGKEGEK